MRTTCCGGEAPLEVEAEGTRSKTGEELIGFVCIGRVRQSWRCESRARFPHRCPRYSIIQNILAAAGLDKARARLDLGTRWSSVRVRGKTLLELLHFQIAFAFARR